MQKAQQFCWVAQDGQKHDDLCYLNDVVSDTSGSAVSREKYIVSKIDMLVKSIKSTFKDGQRVRAVKWAKLLPAVPTFHYVSFKS